MDSCGSVLDQGQLVCLVVGSRGAFPGGLRHGRSLRVPSPRERAAPANRWADARPAGRLQGADGCPHAGDTGGDRGHCEPDDLWFCAPALAFAKGAGGRLRERRTAPYFPARAGAYQAGRYSDRLGDAWIAGCPLVQPAGVACFLSPAGRPGTGLRCPGPLLRADRREGGLWPDHREFSNTNNK